MQITYFVTSGNPAHDWHNIKIGTGEVSMVLQSFVSNKHSGESETYSFKMHQMQSIENFNT